MNIEKDLKDVGQMHWDFIDHELREYMKQDRKSVEESSHLN